MVMALFILILLVSLNRTINRLTKPVSFLVIFSLLASALISSYLYLKKIEGELFLSNYVKVFESKNRYCEYEQTTNQYLGYELTGVKKGQNYKEYVFENMEIGKKIKKYFKF